MSNMLSTRALIELCNNKINDGTKSILVKSLESMPKEAIPQYSNTLNRNANFNLAYAALIYSYLSHREIQDADNSILQKIEEHDYVKLAKKFFAYNLTQDPELTSKESYAAQNMEKADALMVGAVQLYVDSFTLTRGNVGKSYGDVAEKFLLKIAKHQACQDNGAAMDIINNALNAQALTTAGNILTPSFARAQTQAEEVFATQAKSIAPTSKVIFIAGGLSGSGKTTHLDELKKQLNFIGRFVKYLDKDIIGDTMPVGTTSPQIYAEMIVQAEAALETHDVIVMEGNTIGNLSCFANFIREQDAQGVMVMCLDFICSDAQQQFNRLEERATKDKAAAKRDEKKLQSFEYYFDTDRPAEIKRHDDQLAANHDLIANGILHLMVIETSTPSVTENVDKIVNSMQEQLIKHKADSKAEARRGFSALPFAMQ